MYEEDGRPSQDAHNEATHSLPAHDEDWPRLREDALLERAAIEVSDFVQVAPEMALTSALGAMSVACQSLADVAYPNGHIVPCSLMTLIIAESGERKTSLDKWFCNPIREVEREKLDEDKEQQKDYQIHLEIWKTKQSELKKQLRKETRDGKSTEDIEDRLSENYREKPTPPKSHKIIYNDTTPEALAYGLYQNLPLGYLLSDEAGTVFEGRALQDTYLFNDLWSGSNIRIDRKSNNSFILPEARLSASLMIQPEVLNQVLKKRGDKLSQTGFFARFLVVYPKKQVGYRGSLSYNEPGDATKQFQQRIRDRLKRSIDKLEKGEPRDTLQLSTRAQKLWEKLYQAIEEETGADRLYFHVPHHGSKLIENVSRVAGVIHLFEQEDYTSEITEDELKYSYELCRRYSKHYIDHIAGEPKIVTLANDLVRAIRRYGSEHIASQYEFTKSNIQQRAKAELRDDDKFYEALQLLRRTGHIRQPYSNNRYTLYEDLYTAAGTREPEIKNGHFYHIKELPIYESKEELDKKHQEKIEAHNQWKLSPRSEESSNSRFK